MAWVLAGARATGPDWRGQIRSSCRNATREATEEAIHDTRCSHGLSLLPDCASTSYYYAPTRQGRPMASSWDPPAARAECKLAQADATAAASSQIRPGREPLHHSPTSLTRVCVLAMHASPWASPSRDPCSADRAAHYLAGQVVQQFTQHVCGSAGRTQLRHHRNASIGRLPADPWASAGGPPPVRD